MRRSDEDMGALLVHAQDALGMLQRDIGELLGVSTKTIQRWTVGGTHLTREMLVTLTGAVHAKNPALAKRIAAAHGHTLEELGVAVPPSATSAPVRDLRAERILADALVCTAAEVADVSPRRMRAALAAALARARESGLTIEGVHALLSPPDPAKPTPKATTRS